MIQIKKTSLSHLKNLHQVEAEVEGEEVVPEAPGKPLADIMRVSFAIHQLLVVGAEAKTEDIMTTVFII